jgi:TLP18.3/Psb32/MOLO-1 phosphatase superfamily protein
MRWLKHLIARMGAERHFPSTTLDAIQHAIADSEHRHLGEICFAVEGGMPFGEVVAGRMPRERAQAAFARLRVWNTEHNTGVLVYILIADHAIEIVADRGIAARVAQGEWQAVCDRMRERFAAGEFERGAIEGVEAVSDILAREFPGDGTARDNELTDEPIIL